MSLIVAEGISKSYGKVVAVDGVNFSLADGSVTALIGPNGAGKTRHNQDDSWFAEGR